MDAPAQTVNTAQQHGGYLAFQVETEWGFLQVLAIKVNHAEPRFKHPF